MLGLLALLLAGRAHAQQGTAPFQDESGSRRSTAPSNELPRSFRPLTLDVAVLQAVLQAAPLERNSAVSARPVLVLPLPNGTSARFAVAESPILSPALAARYPDIHTYAAVGLDEPGATARLDFTPAGFHAQVISPRAGTFYLNPQNAAEPMRYLSYFLQDARPAAAGFGCGSTAAGTPVPSTAHRQRAGGGSGSAQVAQPGSGTQLRVFNVAIATTGEFTVAHGGNAGTMSIITTVINQVSGIYEQEMAIRLTLAGTLIYPDASTDPYTPAAHDSLIAQNRRVLTSAALGGVSFDIGHVFNATVGGGLAGVGVVCNTSQKSRASSGLFGTVIPTADVQVVAHEMGHQFGAGHTFNSAETGCLTQRMAASAWEPGSGTTIMGYGGGCGADAADFGRESTFNSGSVDQVNAYLTAVGSCGTSLSTGNTLPVVTTPFGGKTLPANTPFKLTAAGTDADGDALTYSWEQHDLGDAAMMADPQIAGQTGPLFRVRAPVSTPTRYFPTLGNILVNYTTMDGERLPTVTRTLKFRCIVHDSHTGSQGLIGGIRPSDDVTLNVTSAAGPFAVTSPNTAVTWASNTSQTVTWDVAGTTGNGVNCAVVNIRLSLDNGSTYPMLLAAATPNDGSQAVIMPNVASTTSTARILVEAADNYFLDISNANFTITPGAGPTASSLSPSSGVAGSTSVVIAGSGFGTSASALSVTIGGVAASVTAVSNTSLTVSVPAAALTGEVLITKTGFGAISAGVFSVTPVLSSLSPSSAAAGASLTLNGSSLSGAIGVTFADGTTVLPASFVLNTAVSPNTITLTVPGTAISGDVYVTTAGGNSNALPFTLVPFTLVSRSPARNALTAPTTGVVALTFAQTPGTSTAAGAPIYVRSALRGGLRNGLGTFGSSGTTVSYTPASSAPFQVGEVVTVTTTAAAANTGGATLPAESYQFTVASGLAAGTLGTAATTSVGTRPYNVRLGDVNGDGILDLVAANYNGNTGNTVSVRLGDGAGGFGAGSADLSVNSGPRGLVLADVNNDGRLDIVVTCTGTSTVNVLMRNASGSGAGDFATAQVLSVDASPRGLAVADLNNDGWADIITACYYSNLVRLQVRLNTQGAGGSFGSMTSTDFTGGLPFALVAADVNNDGWLDMLATNYQTTGSVSVMLNDGTGNLTGPGTTVAVGSSPMGLALADLNGDGNLDLATANQAGNNVSVRLGNGSGGFTSPATPELAVGGGSFAPENVALADLNGDGKADLVATSLAVNPGQLSVRLGTGAGTFTTPTVPEYSAGTQSAGLALADLNSDGALDVATASYGTSTGANGVSVLLGVPVPVVSSINPTSGTPGTAVTISGSGFQSGSTATIGGVALTGVSVVTTTIPQTLSGTVGANSPLGVQSVVVTTGSQTSNTNVTFTVLPPAPTLISFTPTSGAIGTPVTLTGTGFTGAMAVAFNGTAASSFTVVNSTTITAVVASGTTNGTLSVTTPGGTATSTGSFTVLQPSLSGFTPALGAAGTVVTLTGSNLGGVTSVSFNGVAASSFTVVSGATVTAVVPAAAGSGRITLSTASGTLTSATDFEFIPVPAVTTLTPASAAVGQTILLTGTGLNYVTGIRFNEVPARFTVVSPTRISVIVPLLANSGKLRLDSPGGSALSSPSFSIRRVSSSFTFSIVTSNATTSTGSSLVGTNGTNGTNFGAGAALAVADVDGDGLLDVLVGARSGSTTSSVLVHYEQNSTNRRTFDLVSGSTLVSSITLPTNTNGANPRPTFTDLDGDGLLDLVIGVNTGALLHYEQNAANSYAFTAVSNSGLSTISLSAGNPIAPTFTDIDGDGLLDMVVGTLTVLKHYEQSAVNSSSFTDITAAADGLVAASPGALITPTFTDIDGDGRLDLLLGQGSTAVFKHYKQDAVNSRTFTLDATSPLAINIGNTATPIFTDLSGDGRLDLMAGVNGGTLRQYEQGTSALTVSVTGQTVLTGAYSSVTVTGTGEATLEGPVQVTGSFSVQSGGVLTTACQPITGTGSFSLAAGATLGVCDAAGISSSGSTGAVQVSGTRTFDSGASYIYNGTTAQVFGNALPATVRSLTLNNTATLAADRTLALSQNLTTTQGLTLTSGVLSTGSNKVVLGPTATISETSSSYVTGTVQTTRSLNTAGVAETFGSLGLSLTPAGSTLPGSTVVTRTTGSAVSGVGDGSNGSVKRYFDIVPGSNNGSLNVTMTFGYQDLELNSIPKANLGLYKSENGTAGPWVKVSGVTLNATTNTVTATGVSSFSTWALGDAGGSLPVELSAFSATAEGSAARLRWTTASEKNNDHFDVERSLDGREFERIGQVAGQGSKASRTDYTYLDEQLANSPAHQLTYYRLKQVDTDGRFSYSPVRTVSFMQSLTHSFTAFPNPAHGFVLVQGADAGARVELFDVTGRQVTSTTADATGAARLSLPAGLPAGIYVLRGSGQACRLVVE